MTKRLGLLLAVLGLLGVCAGQSSQGGRGSGSGVTITNVAGLANVAGKVKGTIAVVTDGNSATDCTTGGASTVVICQYSGSVWAEIVASSSGATAFSAITGSTNSSAAMVLGTGASLTVSGTGTNTATGLTGSPSITVNGVTAGAGSFTTGTFSSTLGATGHVTFEGVTSTGATGNGLLVFGTSPVLTTPNLGTPSTLTLTNATGLPGHQIALPLFCSDSSASGTAQVCNTSPTFTPVTGDAIIYTTTTANTGAGLTINVNSLGAKSVAKWQGTTTLAANDVLANKPTLLVYDGTNWELSTIGNAPSGGSGTINAAAQFSFPNYSAAGSAQTLSGVTAGSNQGVYVLGRTNTTQGTVAAGAEKQVGDCASGGATVSGATSTYTVLYTDVIGCIITHDTAGSATVVVTIPTPTTLNNTAPFFSWVNNSTHADTLTPTTFQISLAGNAAASTLSVPSNVSCLVHLDPFNASVWNAVCHPNATSGSSGASGAYTILTKTANYTTSSTDFSSSSTAATEVLYTVSSATTVTHTLPNTVTASGTYQYVKNDCASGWGLYVAPANSLTLDGDTTSLFLPPCNTVKLISNGTNWISDLKSERTAGKGGLLLPNLPGLNATTTAGLPLTAINTPFVVQVTLHAPVKVAHLGTSVNTGVASCVFDVALADQGGNILTHISGGAGSACTAAANTSQTPSTVLTLAPGVYYLAQCANTITTVLWNDMSLTQSIYDYQQVADSGSTGTAANACTAGVFSAATLGTITNSTSPTVLPTLWIGP